MGGIPQLTYEVATVVDGMGCSVIGKKGKLCRLNNIIASLRKRNVQFTSVFLFIKPLSRS